MYLDLGKVGFIFAHSQHSHISAFNNLVNLHQKKLISVSYHYRLLWAQSRTSQVTYVTMVPRVGNETLRPLGVATGNALSVTRSEDTYVKTPPVGRRQPMTSLPACHNISAAGRIHHQLFRLHWLVCLKRASGKSTVFSLSNGEH